MAVALCMLAGFPPGIARGEDLLGLYREAVTNDPVLASARANWVAVQEVLPQARANLLPLVSLGGDANYQNFHARVRGDPAFQSDHNFPSYSYVISASQPLYRQQNVVALEQARQQVNQSDYALASTQQDLVLRVAQAYFDVLLAQINIELVESQSRAVSEQLAQAKRNFEVGVATITDTNDAQAKFDQIAAQQIASQNDLDNKIATLGAIVGRPPRELRRFRSEPDLPPPFPDVLDFWRNKAAQDNLAVKIAQYDYDIAALDVDRQRAANYPTVDLVASFNQGYVGATSVSSLQSNVASDSRQALIGVQVNVPLYTGGGVESRVRQAIATQERTRQDLETNRRNAQLNAQTSFNGVESGVAQVKALRQALVSAQVSYDSTKLGLEVGVRTTLDVLNQQQQVFTTRRDLAQSLFNYLLSALRLKQAVGSLSEADLDTINQQLVL